MWGTKLNHKTLVVRASCPLDMYLITPGSAVYEVVISRHQLTQMVTSKKDEHYF